MITVIMAVAKVGNKLLFGDKSGSLPWGKIKADMDHFVYITEPKNGRTFVCSASTYSTLPQAARKRLQPLIIAESITDIYPDTKYVGNISDREFVILGGRKLIEEALKVADHVMVSEIGNPPEPKESHIYLRDSTVKALAEFEMISVWWPFILKPQEVTTQPYLRQAYCLSRN
ncbi:hypothetical protein IACHDJAJ_00073 [Aeromonas phage vB_AdhS_TS3]|nr:hypothetical protein IACHDJAJ_00073 [Aeromonas phage vB_AdhS_TS3]